MQEKKRTKDDGFNELVQGVLTFSIREAYGNMPDEPPEGEGNGGQARHLTKVLQFHKKKIGVPLKGECPSRGGKLPTELTSGSVRRYALRVSWRGGGSASHIQDLAGGTNHIH